MLMDESHIRIQKGSVMQIGYVDELRITTGSHGRHNAASSNELVFKEKFANFRNENDDSAKAMKALDKFYRIQVLLFFI